MLKLIKLGRLNWFLRIVGVLLFYYHLFLLIWNIIKKFWIVRMYYTNYRGGMFKTHQNFFHIGYQEPGTAVVKQGQDLLHRKLIFKHIQWIYLSFWSEIARIVFWNIHFTIIYFFSLQLKVSEFWTSVKNIMTFLVNCPYDSLAQNHQYDSMCFQTR